MHNWALLSVLNGVMAASMDLKDRVRALRKALGRTQEEVADASLDDDGSQIISREVMVKIENGANKGSTLRIREGLARAFGLSLSDANAYLDGTLTTPEVLQRIGKSVLRVVETRHNGDWPGWLAAEKQARLLDTGIDPRDFMGARLMTATRAPRAEKVEPLWVVGWAWVFRESASPDELQRADEAEAEERKRTPRARPQR